MKNGLTVLHKSSCSVSFWHNSSCVQYLDIHGFLYILFLFRYMDKRLSCEYIYRHEDLASYVLWPQNSLIWSMFALLPFVCFHIKFSELVLHLRLVFTCHGIRVSHNQKCRVLRFSENQTTESWAEFPIALTIPLLTIKIVGVVGRILYSEGLRASPVIGLFFHLFTTPIMWFSLDRKQQSHKCSWKKWKCSVSCDSDSITLTTLLTTLLFDFR